MGCEIGRDDEKPVHRVWVDSIELAACQVTNEEYGRFLSATRYPQPFCRNDPNFNHPKMPVVAISWHDAVFYCEWLNRSVRNAVGRQGFWKPNCPKNQSAATGAETGFLERVMPWRTRASWPNNFEMSMMKSISCSHPSTNAAGKRL